MPHAVKASEEADKQVRMRAGAQHDADANRETMYLVWEPEKNPRFRQTDTTLASCSPYWVAESEAAGWEKAQGERIDPTPPADPARAKILAEVSAERARQDGLWGGQAHDDRHSLADWLVILSRHVGLAAWDGSPDDACHKTEATGKYDQVRYRKEIVRVAAVAVAALEAFDRQQQQENTGGDTGQDG